MFTITFTATSSNMNHSEIRCALRNAIIFSVYAGKEATESHIEGCDYSEILIGYSKGGEMCYYQLGYMFNSDDDDVTISGFWRKKGEGPEENWRRTDVLPWLVRGVNFDFSGFPVCVAWRDLDHFFESGMLDLMDCESNGYKMEFIGFTATNREPHHSWLSAYIWRDADYREPWAVSGRVYNGGPAPAF